jgi:hypothetical protein
VISRCLFARFYHQDAATAVLGLTFVGAHVGLAARIERLYVASVVASAGAWVATATVTGATSPPLPQVLVVGGLVLAVPWWAHGRRRARVRVERKLEAWPQIAQAIGATLLRRAKDAP